MSLYQRGNVWWSRIQHHGTVTRRSLKVRSKNEARRLESKLRLQIADGELGIKKPETFEMFAPKFLNYLPARVKPETYRSYTNAIKQLLAFPPIATARLDRIDDALLDQFIQKCREQKHAVATINLRLRTASRLLRLALDWRIIERVPRIRKLPGENQREYVVTAADETRLIEAVKHPTMKALIPFLLETGLRIGEACNLTWKDVTDSTVKITTGKTKFAKRTVPLTDKACAILKQLRPLARPNVPFVFTRHDGRDGIIPIWASHHFTETRRKLGMPADCVLHSLRHSAITRWGAAGMTGFEIQKLAGHGSVLISARYSHPDEIQLSSAMAKMNVTQMKDPDAHARV